MNENQSSTKKISYFFVAVISVMLILSLLALFWASQTYGKDLGASVVNIMLGISAIVLALYMFAMIRRKPLKLGFEMPDVFTTIQCTKCDYKNDRKFQKGDYILKESEPCPKCNSITIISSIYKEVEEKE